MQQKHIVSQLGRPKAPGQSASRAVLPQEVPGVGPSCLSQFLQLPVAQAPLGLWPHHPNLCLFSHNLLPSMRVLMSLFLRGHQSCWVYGSSW